MNGWTGATGPSRLHRLSADLVGELHLQTGFTGAEIDGLRRVLHGARVGGRLVHVAACDSTQDLAQQTAAEAPACDGLVVVADDQRSGRGRMGRRWRQQPGLDLSFSIVLAPPARVAPVALAALLPVGVCLGVEEAAGRRLALKWPNDVFLDRRKLAGTLIEAFRPGGAGAAPAYVVGIGINVNATAFDPEVAATAISLRQALGREVDRAGLLATVLAAIDGAYTAILEGRTGHLVEVLRNRLGLVGHDVEITRGSRRIRGRVEALGLDGFALRLPGGEEVRVALETVTGAAVTEAT